MLRSFGRDASLVDHIDEFVDVPSSSPAPKTNGGVVSKASEQYIDNLKARNTMSGKDISRYARMLSFFQKIVGERPLAPTSIPT